MKKYKKLTKYLDGFKRDTFGKWTEAKGKGTEEDPRVFPYFIYDKDVMKFHDDFYQSKLMDTNYVSKLEMINEKDIADLTEEELLSKLTAVIRSERFCEGAINRNLQDGTIQTILNRLKEIDENR